MLRPFLLQLIKAVWRARITCFWPIWATTTVVAAVSVAWAVGNASTERALDAEKAQAIAGSRNGWTRGAVAAVASLSLFLASYIALILIWEDFTYGDNSVFTLYTLKGYNLAPPIWPSVGRFFPLAHQELNLIRH